jgi:hypothetical protein
VWNLTCKFGELDISFKPNGTEGYDDLAQNAIRPEVHGDHMPVASLADIIRSKEAAGRPKGFTALPALQLRFVADEGTSIEERAAAMSRRIAERRGSSGGQAAQHELGDFGSGIGPG